MVAYELFKKLEKLDYFQDLLQTGIIPITWVDWKVAYEHFLQTQEEMVRKGTKLRNAKAQAITTTADQYRISESHLYKIINIMESN